MTAQAVAQAHKPVKTKKAVSKIRQPTPGAMIVGTGLAVAAIILLPAVAAQIGSATLTSALRIALMRASSRVVAGNNEGGDSIPAYLSCH